jgi:hypothetical protein
MTSAGTWRQLGALLLAGVSLACARVGAQDQRDGGQEVAGVAGAGGQFGPGTGGSGGQIIIITGGRGGTAAPPPLTDFPVDPILTDPTVPANAPTLFDAAARPGSAPCITSPQVGTLIPRNWLRPRVDYQPAGAENLFEITFSIPGFAHTLRVYTRDRNYALDRTLWESLRTTINDQSISVTVRGLGLDPAGAVQLAPSMPAQSTFVIAPVEAPGKIVYWALGNNVGLLKGFGIGEEGTRTVLVPDQVEARTSTEICIGCHAATPDGNGVGFALGMGFYFDSIADVRQGTAGQVPSYVRPQALSALRRFTGVPAFSRAHWSDGDRIVLVSDAGELHWIQLDGERQGVLVHSGDTRQATDPAFRHDGTAVVYVSTTSVINGRAAAGPSDLYQIPYANGAGGPATPVAGAADAANTEYYPAFSSDDALIAFTRLAGEDNVYSNPKAEVFVVPASGGVAKRLAANDPPACQTDLRSPGLTNDWPKWSPDVGRANGRTYYWLTFSSLRSGAAQIYVTAVVVEMDGTITTFPALHLWNQPPDEGNHTPAWDNFQIPPVE